jgi:cytochrome c biogenesis factor
MDIDLEDVSLIFVAIAFALLSAFFGLIAIAAGVHAFSYSEDRLMYLLLALICGVGSAVAISGAVIVLDELLEG